MDRKNSFMSRNDLDRDELNRNDLTNDMNYRFGSTGQFESRVNPEDLDEEEKDIHSESFTEYESDDEQVVLNRNNDSKSKKIKPRGKRREPIPFGFILRGFFTLLAVANLVLLFMFNYKVPGFSYVITKLENYRDHVEGVDGTVADADNTVIFEYDKDTYTYGGKGEFDPTVDVAVKSLAGNELSKDFLTYSVVGESSKQIVYSYKSDDGQYYGTNNRDLKLENYNAPIIVVHGTVPTLTDDNLVKVADLCEGIYTASDGYGKDISDKVMITAVPDTQYNGEFVVQFSVTNSFGDTAKNELRTTTEFQKPHMKLTKTEETLTRGEAFDPHSYVLYAVDANGSNIMDLVDYEGNVDTFKAGEYKVKYELTTTSGQTIKNKKLTVHIVD